MAGRTEEYRSVLGRLESPDANGGDVIQLAGRLQGLYRAAPVAQRAAGSEAEGLLVAYLANANRNAVDSALAARYMLCRMYMDRSRNDLALRALDSVPDVADTAPDLTIKTHELLMRLRTALLVKTRAAGFPPNAPPQVGELGSKLPDNR